MSPASKISALVIATLAAGCAQYRWQKPGGSEADFNRDMYRCEMDAARAFPPHFVQREVRSGYTEPATTRCSASDSTQGKGSAVIKNSSSVCTTTPARYVPPAFQTVDANATPRSDATTSCLHAQGYRRVKVE